MTCFYMLAKFILTQSTLFLILVVIPFVCHAQSRVYTTDGSFQEGLITRVDNTIIEYKLTSGNSEINQRIQSLQVLAIFFPNGQFEVYPFEEKEILDYQHLPNLKYDVLMTAYGELIRGKINNVEGNKVNFYDLESSENIELAYNELLLGIYASGKHAMFRDPAQSLKLLKHLGKELKFLVLNDSKNGSPSSPTYLKNSETSEKPGEMNPPADVMANSENDADGTVDVDLEEFQDKAMQKIDDLSSFISIISNKSTYPDQANQAIELAVALFINEESMVEVSTVGYSQSIRRKIRDYLTRLKLLKYDRVEIKWADLNYVSDFRLGPDGNYYGTVSLKQTFDGFLDERLVYSDVTEKQVEIVLKSFKKAVGGEEQIVWDVLLSDIGVLDTKNK